MKDYQAAINEILEVCQKHRIFLVGTDYSEGIYGEISIGDLDNLENFEYLNLFSDKYREVSFKELRNQITNKLENSYRGLCVTGIGTLD